MAEEEQGGRDRAAEGLTKLGSQGTRYAADYDPSLLETFENKHQDHDYMVTFRCPEFTTLCPITGQPDFATLYINYIPHVRMVESKSLKLYLFSFRNHGDFHEDVTNVIMKDLGARHVLPARGHFDLPLRQLGQPCVRLRRGGRAAHVRAAVRP
jgi:7-cyano-7-deazaguanine reductase